MLCLQAMGRDTEVHVCKGSEFAFGVKSSGRSYDAVRAQIVEQDKRIKCARSAHEDSSIYIYIYIYIYNELTAEPPPGLAARRGKTSERLLI